jgi:hypothetical protein
VAFQEARALPVGINLAWDACGPSGVVNRDFACDSNDEVHAIVASFVPPEGLNVIGCNSNVAFRSPDQDVLPAWWHVMDPASCRPSGLTAEYEVRADSVSCLDFWRGAAFHAERYALGEAGPGTARLRMTAGVPQDLAGPITGGVEHFGFRLLIRTDRTLGTDSCSGCSVRMEIELEPIIVIQVLGLPDVRLELPLRQTVITWQGNVVPAAPTTWGRIKGMYR